eukprot:6202288-Pleurochrysis_carterae.AAC.2
MRQVEQHPFCRGHHVQRGARHGSAEHAYCVSNVGPRLRGAIKQSADEGLVRGSQGRVGRDALMLLREEGCVDEEQQIVGGGRMFL